jgi:glycosyltransferase involved in cell wall biosynthesis
MKMGFVTIYTAHDYTLACPYGGFFDYRKNGICTLRGLSLACLGTKCNTSSYGNKAWYWLRQFVFDRVARIPKRLSHVVFISELNRKVLLPYLGRNVGQTIVTNLADYQAATTPEPITPESPFVFIGALVPHKDPLTAARAAKMIGAPLVIVGGGPLEEQIRREYPETVVTGWVGSEEVERRLRSARALVFPSIWYEAHPCVTMEAAVSGRGIIASDASAAVEQVRELGAGAIFPAGDVAALADAMLPYLDTCHAKEQGDKTREGYFKLELSTDRYVKTLLGIYQQELAAKR